MRGDNGLSARFASNFERGLYYDTDKMTKELAEALGFSEDEKAALDKAREKTIFFDEDCPEITPEQALKFRRVNPRKGELEKRE